MPNTRASTRRLTSKRVLRGATSAASHDDARDSTLQSIQEEIEAGKKLSIMDNLREATSGLEELCAQIQYLKQENGSLRTELQQTQQRVYPEACGSSSPRERDLQREIRSLERTIVELKAARDKDRRTIKELRDKEVERDVKELAGGPDETVPTLQTDLSESAITLLRHVCETIDMNTLAEGEECAVCMEKMEVGMCYSLPCRHPICVGCFGRLGSGAHVALDVQTSSVQCPHCREICERDECEIITHTAVQQWDLLLDISRKWVTMDVGEVDINEDDEDSFIDDGSVQVPESPHLPETLGGAADLDSEVSAASTSADDTGPVTYNHLPSPLKRKRLAALAAQRLVKQRS